jgi:hypothetical protein
MFVRYKNNMKFVILYISQTKLNFDKIFYKVVYHHIIYMCDSFLNLDDFFLSWFAQVFPKVMICPPVTVSPTNTMLCHTNTMLCHGKKSRCSGSFDSNYLCSYLLHILCWPFVVGYGILQHALQKFYPLAIN